MVCACGLDRLLGDPQGWPHPVVLMGWFISGLRRWAEAWGADSPCRLRIAGFLIMLALVGGSGLAGWIIERLALKHPASLPLLLVGMASCLAGRSLNLAVMAVLQPLNQKPADLGEARQRLSGIVGRDTTGLSRSEIVRATAETASENAVDGLFAPLFWLLVGTLVWCAGLTGWPGPLAIAWGFKASSTLDSMLGYRIGKLQWLGTAGARLDDLMVWLPCRLVALSLGQLGNALRDGKADPSPNAGVSQAAYAHAIGIRMGGVNHYKGEAILKPILNKQGKEIKIYHILKILKYNQLIALSWQGIGVLLIGAFIGGK